MLRIIISLVLLCSAHSAFAEEATLHEDVSDILRAKVTEVVSSEDRKISGVNAMTTYQTLKATLLDGVNAGEEVIVENDYLNLSVGDVFFLSSIETLEGKSLYSVLEPDRRFSIWMLIGLFVVVVVALGGLAAARTLLALGISLVVIVYGLLPAIIAGYSPVLMALVFSVVIVGVAMLVTHGANRRTLAAFLGSCGTVLVSVFLAQGAVAYTRLTGFISDESAILNLATGGTLDFSGIFLGAILIGLLGLLDDIAVTQATAVEEIYETDTNLSRREVYKKAMRIGQEHLAAVVNTLALAYAGASLPLLLFFSLGDTSPLMLINREVFAAEIVRTIVGGIGLVLTVPISTYIATVFLVRKNAYETQRP